jgi:hypothetical protein
VIGRFFGLSIRVRSATELRPPAVSQDRLINLHVLHILSYFSKIPPNMALTIAGAHVAIGPLLHTCYSVVKGINQLHQSYEFMPLTLSSIIMTCNTTRLTLKQVDSALADDSGNSEDLHEGLLDQFDGIQIGCTMTLSLLEKHVAELLNVANRDIPLEAQKIPWTAKLKAVYNESDMKELFGQLKDYNALLNTIRNHLQRYENFLCVCS